MTAWESASKCYKGRRWAQSNYRENKDFPKWVFDLRCCDG